jgi:hypothetical protein
VEVQFHAFLTSTLAADACSVSCRSLYCHGHVAEGLVTVLTELVWLSLY